MNFSLVLFCTATAAVALAAPIGEEEHLWITKISAEGKKAIKDVVLDEKQDPIEKWISIDKIVQKEGADVKKAYAVVAERLKTKFEEKNRRISYSTLQKFHQLVSHLSPGAKAAVSEIITVFKSAGSPFTKAPKIKEIIGKQTPAVKKELVAVRDELFPNAEKIKALVLSKLG
ncbi:hypothetical protein PMAYCL1PPCAC_31454, partial [Pristionchus mayeri]